MKYKQKTCKLWFSDAWIYIYELNMPDVSNLQGNAAPVGINFEPHASFNCLYLTCPQFAAFFNFMQRLRQTPSGSVKKDTSVIFALI